MTARGRPTAESVEGVLAFLDLGHERAVRSFVDLTTDAMHELWGLKT